MKEKYMPTKESISMAELPLTPENALTAFEKITRSAMERYEEQLIEQIEKTAESEGLNKELSTTEKARLLKAAGYYVDIKKGLIKNEYSYRGTFQTTLTKK